MPQLSAEQVAQIAYQAGFRDQDLVNIVAIGKRESGYDPAAHRTNKDRSLLVGDLGLWQINYTHIPGLRQAGIINGASDLFDPVTNARAAFYLYQKGGLGPWAAGPGGWRADGQPTYGTNVGAAQQAVNNAQSQGLLGQQYGSGQQLGPNAAGASTPGGPAASLPPDARVIQVQGGPLAAAFQIGNTWIWYQLDGTGIQPSGPVEQMTLDQWTPLGWVMGGSALELAPVSPTFGSYKGFWDSVVGQVMGYNNPAKNDPDVLRVIAEYAARPDMSQEELRRKLEATAWFQSRTTDQLAWNDMSDAERQKKRADVAAQMAQAWFQFAGVSVSADDPRIANYLEDVASGKTGFGSWTETVVKRSALDNGESPWSRTIRDEEEAQRQRPIDIENTALRVRGLGRQWGVQLSEPKIQELARGLIEKTVSDDDVTNLLKQQAMVLYPWKDPELDTMTAAGPWMDTYRRVMEREADLFNPKVQSALTLGQPVFEFEQQLKKSDEWLTTKNARTDLTSLVGEVGAKLGFGAA